MSIPHILHQTWRSRSMPQTWRTYQKKARALHPTWAYHFWTDENNLQLVAEHYPQYFALYQSLPLGVNRADMARYLYLHYMGGVYLDLDYELLKPLDALLANQELVLPYGRQKVAGDTVDQLGNCILASCPGHPLWLHILDSLAERLAQAKLHHTLNDAIGITGPQALTDAIFTEGTEGALLPARELFHPFFHPGNTAEYQVIVRRGTAYGLHHCAYTWRPKEHPLRERVQNVLRRVFHPTAKSGVRETSS